MLSMLRYLSFVAQHKKRDYLAYVDEILRVAQDDKNGVLHQAFRGNTSAPAASLSRLYY